MAEKAKKEVSLSVDTLAEQAKAIADIDQLIAQATGNDASARKAVVDQLVASHGETVTKLFDQLMKSFQSVEGEVLVGLMAKVEEAIKGDLKVLTDKVIDEKVASAATVKPEDVTKLKEQRKARAESFRAIKTILDSLGIDTSEVQEPKRSGGGRPAGSGSGSKSGANKEGYRFLMDGKPRPRSQNSFSSLAYYATDGLAMTNEDVSTLHEQKDSRLGAKQLMAVLANDGIKYGEDDTWEITLPNKTVVGARRMTEQDKQELGVEEPATTDSTPTETPAVETPAEEQVPANA